MAVNEKRINKTKENTRGMKEFFWERKERIQSRDGAGHLTCLAFFCKKGKHLTYMHEVSN